jgi:thiamine biosynthesis lipoprotein
MRELPASFRAKSALPVALVLVAVLVVQRLVCAEAASEGVQGFAGETMGTTWSVRIAAQALTPDERERIEGAVLTRLDEVNRLMSSWDPDSELSRFNRAGAGEPFPASLPILTVFRVAQATSELSDGAFDVTVGPLVDAWGFGAGERLPRGPQAAELARLRDRVGWRLVAVDPAAGMLTKQHAGVVCDLSGVAKGYAVDRVAEALGELGYASFLVEIGGELRGRGRKLDGSPWRVAIEAPDPAARRLHRTVPLENAALATSGDYRKFYREEGRWLSHLIDPRTARPVDHGLASVSVLHPKAVWADAWATALIVLGPERGPAVAEREGLAAHFIVREADGRFAERSTRAFEELAGAGAGSDRGPRS